MHRVDYCITTLDRPRELERLLLSIAAHSPEAVVHIADQGRAQDPGHQEELARASVRAGLRRAPTFHRLPFDCGVSAARNHLLDSTFAEYKLFLDDDFAFTSATDVGALVRLLDAHPAAGVAGGAVVRNGRVPHAGTWLRRRGRTLDQVDAGAPQCELGGLRFHEVDHVPMFALMRSTLLSQLRWDEDLKTGGEEFDFFLRLKETPYTVLYTPDVAVDHPPAQAAESYRRLRWRSEFLERVLEKHGLTTLRAVTGAIAELDDQGRLRWYCELPPAS